MSLNKENKKIILNKIKILQEKIINEINESDYYKPIKINNIECDFEPTCLNDKGNFLSGVNFFYELLKKEIEE